MRTSDRTSACKTEKQFSCAGPLDGDSVETVCSNTLQVPERCHRSSTQRFTKSFRSKHEASAYSEGKVHQCAGDVASQGTISQEQRKRQTELHFSAPPSGSLELPMVPETLQDKDSSSSVAPQERQKQSSVLDVAPMAVRCPSYGTHFSYELSNFKAFWSCDLHYRDWRQVVAASPFPNVVPPNRLLIVRFIICLVVVVAEVVAIIHNYQVTGWASMLYFTSTYCILECIFWMLLTAMSFRALVTWAKPLHATPDVASFSTTGHSSETLSRKSCSTEQKTASSVYPCKFKPSWPTTAPTGTGAGSEFPEQALVSSGRDRIRKMIASIKKFWRMQGYKDLLADRRFCVDGIILAPNPTCSAPTRATTAGSCGSGSDSTCSEPKDYGSSGVKPVQPPLVSILWIMHSLQLVCSTAVFIIFFASMRANGTSFTEFWYTVWRHSILIFIAIFHSALLTRIPFPMRHVVFAYIILSLYMIVQVCVFALGLSNGEGDTGCVYRAFSLERPYQFVGSGFACIAVIAAVAVCWWSLLRQRCADVDPPPSVSVPAAQLLKEKQDLVAAQV